MRVGVVVHAPDQRRRHRDQPVERIGVLEPARGFAHVFMQRVDMGVEDVEQHLLAPAIAM